MSLDFNKAQAIANHSMSIANQFALKLREYLAGDSMFINTYTNADCSEDGRLTHTEVPLDKCWWDTSGGYNYHKYTYHADDHSLSDEWWEQVVGGCDGSSEETDKYMVGECIPAADEKFSTKYVLKSSINAKFLV